MLTRSKVNAKNNVKNKNILNKQNKQNNNMLDSNESNEYYLNKKRSLKSTNSSNNKNKTDVSLKNNDTLSNTSNKNNNKNAVINIKENITTNNNISDNIPQLSTNNKIDNTINSKQNDNISMVSDINIEKSNCDYNMHKLKMSIINQLEFYFSLENLIYDKYFFGLIKSDKENAVKIEEIISFNKIKNILKEIKTLNLEDKNSIINYIRFLVEKYSNKLFISSCRKKIYFNYNKSGIKLNSNSYIQKIKNTLDNRTIYIRNIPIIANNETLYSAFKKYGEIKLVKLPKNNKNTHNNDNSNQEVNKGYAFITYSNDEEAKEALSADNKILKEFLKLKIKKIEPIKVLNKFKWLIEQKEKQKEEQRNILNSKEYYYKLVEQINKIDINTCCEIINIGIDIFYYDLRKKLAKIVNPEYIDYIKENKDENNANSINAESKLTTKDILKEKTKGGNYKIHKNEKCILRFKNKANLNEFMSKVDTFIDKTQFIVNRLEKEFEIDYIKKVKELKLEFLNNKYKDIINKN